MIINHLMKESDVSFGTSGVRGLAKNMTFLYVMLMLPHLFSISKRLMSLIIKQRQYVLQEILDQVLRKSCCQFVVQ